MSSKKNRAADDELQPPTQQPEVENTLIDGVFLAPKQARNKQVGVEDNSYSFFPCHIIFSVKHDKKLKPKTCRTTDY